MKEITFTPLGIIHSPFQEQRDAPYQSRVSEAKGTIEVFEEYERGLLGIERYSHLEIYFRFHKSQSYSLVTTPHGHEEERGVFTTRSPHRPNFLGNSVVKLIERKENQLIVKGIDVLDKTPLLDIKPYSSGLYTLNENEH